MSRQIQAKRDNAIAMVKAGTWAAQDTYKNRDGMGAYTKGMLEPYEAQAKASGLGIWANASQADRSSAASYRAPVKVAAKSDQRAAALGVDPRAYAASGGKLLPPSISSTPSFSSTPRRSLQAVTGSSPYEDPVNKEKQSRLDTLRGYLEEFKGTDAEAGYQRGIDQLSRELEEAYKPAPAQTPSVFGSGVNSAGRQTSFNAELPQTRTGYRTPSQPSQTATTPAASMNGEGNNNVGKLTPPLPDKSNYADVPNRFDETYTGRLLAQARGQAEQEAALGARRLRESMAERGLTQNGISGLEAQGLREIEMNRQNNLGNMSRDAQVQSAQLASGFDMQRAGALDAFDMNRGNLGLGYAADARAGMLINGQVRAQELSNQAQGLQNQVANQDAWYYTTQEAANNRAARDNFQTLLAGSQYEGANIGNAMRGLDFQTQQALLDTAIRQGRNQGTISDAEASAAQQLAAQGGAWWDSPWLKNFLRAALVGGGAVAGSLVPGVGTAAGAIAGGTAAGAIR